MPKGNGQLSGIEDFTDVIVVGGGPGGCAAAIWCALKNLRVVLIESQEFPRHRPGETLHPGVNSLLRQLGVEQKVMSAGFLRHSGHWVTWGGSKIFQSFGEDEQGPWLGYQALRSRFDAILLERTMQLGVAVLQPCKAIKPLIKNGRIVGVQSSFGNVQGRYVVDATGNRHWLGRHLGNTLYYASPPLTAHYGYVQGFCPERHGNPSLIADSTGWTWTARVEEDLYHWTRLSFSRQNRRRFAAPREFRNLTTHKSPKGSDVTWRMVATPAGAGYFIVGDAVSVVDPLSSHGVIKALLSGIRVGHFIELLTKRQITEMQAVNSYRDWISAWFEHDISNLKYLYSQLNFGPDWSKV